MSRKDLNDHKPLNGVYALIRRSVLDIVRRPIYWAAFFALPLFVFLFLSSMMSQGLPQKVPAAIVDRDGTSLSRQVSQSVGSMQLVDLKMSCNSFTQARQAMTEGKIYGFFLIPENFERDLADGREPVITFYTNMVYYVPGELLYKTFKTCAVYTKAGVVVRKLQDAGAASYQLQPLLNPISTSMRPIGNPWLSYPVYLCTSFIPCALQLMILLVTVWSLGQDVKYRRSRQLLRQADGSVAVVLFTKLLPQTLIWIVVALFMETWLFKWNEYPMNGSWGWLTLSEILFVCAVQAFGVFIYGVLPNLRLALSVCSLLGILSFSIAAFSFPVQSMYPAMGIFSYIIPIRYNFLIYSSHVLNGNGIYYSRIWFAAYCVFMLLPLAILPRLKKSMLKEVYVP